MDIQWFFGKFEVEISTRAALNQLSIVFLLCLLGIAAVQEVFNGILAISTSITNKYTASILLLVNVRLLPGRFRSLVHVHLEMHILDILIDILPKLVPHVLELGIQIAQLQSKVAYV